jgi:hypothetical protein
MIQNHWHYQFQEFPTVLHIISARDIYELKLGKEKLRFPKVQFPRGTVNTIIFKIIVSWWKKKKVG